MDARTTRAALLAVAILFSLGAKYRTTNYIVETADPAVAAQLGETAERYRHDLAIAWLGQPLPNWSQPCPMTVRVGPTLGAGGATSFVFDRGEVFGWRMTIQGSYERLMDSVLPHEITHMIFASHFRQPLPRWADEGGATSVECVSERTKHREMLCRFLQTGRGIAFNQMFAMRDYPADVMPLYAQGYVTCDYLIQLGGRRRFVEFLDAGLEGGQWNAALRKFYGLQDTGDLQNQWLAWVKQGMPNLSPTAPGGAAAPAMIAAAVTPPSRTAQPAVMPTRLSPAASAPATLTPASTLALAATAPNAATAARVSIYARPQDAALAASPRATSSQPRAMVPVAAPATIDASQSLATADGWRASGAFASRGAAVAGSLPGLAVASTVPQYPGQPTMQQTASPQDFQQPGQLVLER